MNICEHFWSRTRILNYSLSFLDVVLWRIFFLCLLSHTHRHTHTRNKYIAGGIFWICASSKRFAFILKIASCLYAKYCNKCIYCFVRAILFRPTFFCQKHFRIKYVQKCSTQISLFRSWLCQTLLSPCDHVAWSNLTIFRYDFQEWQENRRKINSKEEK